MKEIKPAAKLKMQQNNNIAQQLNHIIYNTHKFHFIERCLSLSGLWSAVDLFICAMERKKPKKKFNSNVSLKSTLCIPLGRPFRERKKNTKCQMRAMASSSTYRQFKVIYFMANAFTMNTVSFVFSRAFTILIYVAVPVFNMFGVTGFLLYCIGCTFMIHSFVWCKCYYDIVNETKHN